MSQAIIDNMIEIGNGEPQTSCDKCDCDVEQACSRETDKEVTCPIMAKMTASINGKQENSSNHASVLTSLSNDGLNMQGKKVSIDGITLLSTPEGHECQSGSACYNGQKGHVKRSPVQSGNDKLSQQDSMGTGACPMRKVSNISSVSSSGGSDEIESERKLDLRSLIDSIGTLLIPTVSDIVSIQSELNRSFGHFLLEKKHRY